MATNKNKDKAPELNIPETEDQELDETAEKLEEMVQETQKPAAETSEVAALKAEIAELKAILKAQADQKAAEEAEAEESRKIAEQAAKVIEDAWEEFEEVYVPRHGKGQEPSFYISVNSRTVQIPADGKLHRIRKPFAEILRMSIEAEAAAEDYAEKDVPHEAAPANYEQLMSVIDDMKKKLREAGIV